MIRSVTAVNHLNEGIVLELSKPETSGFIVRKISGLGPGSADVNVTEVASFDGGMLNSSRLPSRNIVLDLGFTFDPTIEAVRHRSYKYFPLKRTISLIFETDERICQIDGIVEKNEPSIFEEEESAQISIICTNPYFMSAGDDGLHTTNFYSANPNFEFPFPEEDKDDPSIEMNIINDVNEASVWYMGDVEAGFMIYIHATGNVEGLMIYNARTRETMSFDDDKLAALTGSKIKAGDEIIISTFKGDKYVELLRNGVYTNILNCISRDADWFTLDKGDNIFGYTAEYGADHVQMRIENRELYGGI